MFDGVCKGLDFTCSVKIRTSLFGLLPTVSDITESEEYRWSSFAEVLFSHMDALSSGSIPL